MAAQYTVELFHKTVPPHEIQVYVSSKPVIDMKLRGLVVPKPRDIWLWFVHVTQQVGEGLNYLGYCLNASLSQCLPSPSS